MFEPPWSVTDWNSPREPQRGDAGSGGGLRGSLRRLLRPRRGAVEARVFVLGTVGTDAVTDRLCAVLDRRGHATRAVTIGEGDPALRGRGERGAVETLVVNAHDDSEAVRRAQDMLGPPDVVVVTAAGRDSRAARGPGRGDVVRSIAGSVPAGAHVVNAEGTPAVRRYLATAVERRGATISHVGAHDADAPGAELGSAIDGALAALEEPPMPDEEREAFAAASHPEWLDLRAGRCYDALGVTDTVALERLRYALCPDREPIELVVVTDRERRDVAATLADYASDCHERRLIPTVYAIGPLSAQFADRCTAPTVDRGGDAPAGRVLDEALAAGPTIVVGPEGTPAGTAIADSITERIERSGTARIG
ncbi:Mur ligase family CapB protein [Salinarchaeum sp. Harcht-Bsk1]|uniref:Mur ligase family CapB protein n=1 Tax=Salinarchaeum sp. Harcht-Bsk1 TaxID=1333523 RepID=UPI000342429A|nr:Mur ligase family CapB protein [Salinarchaeum sp. Harcht-Bsk1]AGN01542.1 Mur ligase family CapB protein [Salinarchaeum sp. Harcht-Bsk1]